MVRKYGYPSETHTVVTKDGYILEIHRIPKIGAKPILLMHGILDTSATWVLMGPKSGLGTCICIILDLLFLKEINAIIFSCSIVIYNFNNFLSLYSLQFGI